MKDQLVHRQLPHRVWLLAVVALAASACTSASGEAGLGTSTSTSTSITTTTSAPPTTTTPTTAPAPPPEGIMPGAEGPHVEALQRTLDGQRFSVGPIDGTYGAMTVHAVMAFQKTFGLPRTGKADPATLARIAEAPVPHPMLPDGGPDRIEIDLDRQMLQLYLGGELHRVLSVSTGNKKRYCENGKCGVAITPGGSYRVSWRHKGIRVSPLGKLWNPLFFVGGIAIHGSPSVPAGPASHGCVRIPIPDSVWFYDTVKNGTPVYVLNGNRPAVPFTPPPPPETTTTTQPAPTSSTTTAPSSTTTAPPPTSSTTVAPTPTTAPPP